MKNEEKSDTSADSSLHHDDDQQGIFSSESESDEDLIPPPPTKRKRSNQSVKSLGNTKSKVFFLFYGKKRNLTFIIDFYFIEKFKSKQGKFICHTKKKRKVISEEFWLSDSYFFGRQHVWHSHKLHKKRKPKAFAGKYNMIVRIISLFNLYFPFKDEPLTEPVNADVQDDVYVQPHFRVQ